MSGLISSNHSAQALSRNMRYVFSMSKLRKPKWERKLSCECVKADLPKSRRVVIRCAEHRGKLSKSGRVLCYRDADGIVRREAPPA